MDELTLKQFAILRKAHEYREVDLDFRIHQLAYLTFVATGQKKAGKNKQKPIYSTFQKFFDYKKELRELDTKKKSSPHIEAMRRMERNHNV